MSRQLETKSYNISYINIFQYYSKPNLMAGKFFTSSNYRYKIPLHLLLGVKTLIAQAI